MEQTNFEQMLDALAQGDRAAFQQFYDQYGLPVYRYLLEKTRDAARTRQLWKDVFRALMDRMRATPQPDLPLLLLTALADLQLNRDPARESVESQAERLSSEWVDELHTPAAPVPEAAPPVPDEPANQPTPEPEEFTAQKPDFFAVDAPSYEPEPDPDPEPDDADPDAPTPTESPRPHTRRTGWIVLLVVLILVVLAALWIGAGFAMSGGMLPYFDLGYSWFNQTIFPLFQLG